MSNGAAAGAGESEAGSAGRGGGGLGARTALGPPAPGTADCRLADDTAVGSTTVACSSAVEQPEARMAGEQSRSPGVLRGRVDEPSRVTACLTRDSAAADAIHSRPSGRVGLRAVCPLRASLNGSGQNDGRIDRGLSRGDGRAFVRRGSDDVRPSQPMWAASGRADEPKAPRQAD